MKQEKLKEVQVKRFYRAKELSILIGVGLSTIWAYSKEGRITPIKISSRVTVFDIDEVNRMFEVV